MSCIKSLNNTVSWISLLLISIALTACGGGGSSDSLSLGGNNSQPETQMGTLQLALTDAEEDFLTYRVTLNSISLVAAGGDQISLLSEATEIDFVQYQTLSELFAVRDVPEGRYDQIILELDYSNAEIIIQDENALAYSATAVDAEGNPVTTLSVELSFGDAETVRITAGRIARLTLDLDLSASNEILGFDPARVQVSPIIIATPELDDDREHRVRGLLQSVDETASTIQLDLRPLRMDRGDTGELVVETNADTLFNLNGEESIGATGLSALSAMPVDTALIGFGSIDEVSGNLVLSRVNAGERSTDMRDTDVAKGIVVARNGNQLTLAAVVVETGDGASRFRSSVTLTVGDDTLITGYRLGDANAQTLSVGQSVLALGDYVAGAEEGEGSMDATSGAVQLRANQISGTTVSSLPLSLNLDRINRLTVDRFDFSGTGGDPLLDSDPANYEINAATLNTSGIEDGEWIEVTGYPTAFGSALGDFDATLIRDPDETSLAASLAMVWDAAAESTISVEIPNILLNTENARVRFAVEGNNRRVQVVQIQPEVVTGNDRRGRFTIETTSGRQATYRDYSAFLVDVQSLLNEGRNVDKLTAQGQFDATTAVLTAANIVVRFETRARGE